MITKIAKIMVSVIVTLLVIALGLAVVGGLTYVLFTWFFPVSLFLILGMFLIALIHEVYTMGKDIHNELFPKWTKE